MDKLNSGAEQQGKRFFPRGRPRMLYRMFLLVCISVCTQTSFSQDAKIDSLNRLITAEKTDTGRIRLNVAKVDMLSKNDLNAAISLGLSQLKEAERAGYYWGIVKLRNQLANNYIFTGDYERALENIHFLEKYIRPKDSASYAMIASSYGMMYGVKAQYDSSILFYQTAIALNERLHNNAELPANYSNIAIGYQQLANYPMALEYQQRSLSLSKKGGNKILEAKTLMNLGITLQNFGDTARAIQNYLSSIRLAHEIGSRIVELYGYSNLAGLYIGLRDWSHAYDLAMKAATLASASGDLGIQAASLAKAATSRAYQGQFAEATSLSEQSIAIAESSTQPLNISQACNAMALTLYLQKKYDEAIPWFEKTFEVLPGAAIYDMGYGEAYKMLSKCYEETGNFQQAFYNYRHGVSISDSMHRKDNIRRATELTMNFEFEKKQEIEEAEQRLKDKISHSKQVVLLTGLGIFLLLSVLAFIGYKNKQKANSLLKQQKNQIESTLTQLKSTQAQLIQTEKMASLGELTAGIAHEIQNPLNFVTNFSELSTELFAELRSELDLGHQQEALEIADSIRGNLEKINHHGKRADAIVKGMLQHSRSSAGRKERTDINSLVDEFLRLSYHGLRAKDQTFTAHITADLDPAAGVTDVIQPDIGRVLLNLFNNAFYAVNERYKEEGSDFKPTVTVTTRRSENAIEITVGENGKGIPESVKEKIFQPFFTTKPAGQGTGLGLSLSYDIIKAHGGEISLESREGHGSRFTVRLPAE